MRLTRFGYVVVFVALVGILAGCMWIGRWIFDNQHYIGQGISAAWHAMVAFVRFTFPFVVVGAALYFIGNRQGTWKTRRLASVRYEEKLERYERDTRARRLIELKENATTFNRAALTTVAARTYVTAAEIPDQEISPEPSGPRGMAMNLAVDVQERYWHPDRFDPADSDTMPKQKDIVEWIKTQRPGISDARARAIEQVACPIDRG